MGHGSAPSNISLSPTDWQPATATWRSADNRAVYRLSAVLSVAHAFQERDRERKRDRKPRSARWTRLFIVIAIVDRAREADTRVTSTRGILRVYEPPRLTGRQDVTHTSSFNTFLGNVRRFFVRGTYRRKSYFLLASQLRRSLVLRKRDIAKEHILSPPEVTKLSELSDVHLITDTIIRDLYRMYFLRFMRCLLVSIILDWLPV